MTMNCSRIVAICTLTLAAIGGQSTDAEARSHRWRSQCETIGGTIAASILTTDEGQAIVGSVFGSLQGAVRGLASPPEPHADGTVRLTVVDHFVLEDGATLEAEAEVILTPVPGLTDVFHEQTAYEVRSGTGRLEGATGTLTGHGEVDLNRGQVTVRYEGRLCGPSL